MTAEYPPQPWRLRGDLHSSVFLVPLVEVPADLPPDCRWFRLGLHAVVAIAWVRYQPGGVLAYDELMSTLLVRRGWRLMPTITHIWVDSPASRDGGRALWGIRKELAAFGCAGSRLSAVADAGPIAAATVFPGRSLPGMLPCGFDVVQRHEGLAKVTPVRVRARIGFSRATFTANPAGPLRFLAGRRPVLSFSLLGFRMTFGRA